MDLAHHTINTGHTRMSPRSEIDPRIIEQLIPLARAGKGELPAPLNMFSVQTTMERGGAAFTVFGEREGAPAAPLAICALCWDQAQSGTAWAAIEQVYLRLSDTNPAAMVGAEARQPETFPWVSCMVVPAALMMFPDSIGWLGDFERCMAWTIMEIAGVCDK